MINEGTVKALFEDFGLEFKPSYFQLVRAFSDKHSTLLDDKQHSHKVNIFPIISTLKKRER
jgi:hypothetical protein